MGSTDCFHTAGMKESHLMIAWMPARSSAAVRWDTPTCTDTHNSWTISKRLLKTVQCTIEVHYPSSTELTVGWINWPTKNLNTPSAPIAWEDNKAKTLFSAPAPVRMMFEFSTCTTRCPKRTRYAPIPMVRHETYQSNCHIPYATRDQRTSNQAESDNLVVS